MWLSSLTNDDAILIDIVSSNCHLMIGHIGIFLNEIQSKISIQKNSLDYVVCKMLTIS